MLNRSQRRTELRGAARNRRQLETKVGLLPIAREMVVRSIADARSEGKCDGNDCRGFGKKGYGQFLGTAMAAAWFEVLMLLPEDRVIDEEKEHYPRAFSDGEISYET